MSPYTLKTNFLFFIFIFALQSQAQTLSGKLFSEEHKPLSSATVALLSDSTLLAVTTTGEDGKFYFTQDFESGRAYSLRISNIGYKSLVYKFIYKTPLPAIQLGLTKDNTVLREVSVTARMPVITRRADRYIINVENSFLSEGHTAIDILEKSPGVWVDNKGRILLRGNKPVTVMINDVVQRMNGDELTDYLRSIPSGEISSIEIIAQPPAEFESEGSGGIVRIVLKRARRSGLNGTVNNQYRQQGAQPYFTTGVSLNYGYKRLYFLGSYNHTMDKRSIIEKASVYSLNNRYNNSTDRFEQILRNLFRMGLVYDLSSMQSISLQSTLTKSEYPGWFRSKEMYKDSSQSEGSSTSAKQRNFDLRSMTLNYAVKIKRSANLKVIADYTDNRKREKNDYLRQRFVPPIVTAWRNEVPIATKIFTLQADFSKTIFSKGLVTSGVKYADVYRDNKLLTENLDSMGWQANPLRSNSFQYSEKLAMAYTSLELSQKNTIVKVGIRAEETFSNGDVNSGSIKFKKSYFNWFPSLFITQSLDSGKGSALTFAYNRRIARPSLSDLNPARVEFSYYESLQGNPALLPEDNHNFSLSGIFNKRYSVELFFTHTAHSIGLSAYPGENGSIEYISENIGTNNEWGLNLSTNENVTKRWSISSNIGIDHVAYSFNGIAYRQFSVRGKMLHTLSIERFADFDLSLNYNSPYRYTNLYTYGNFTTAAGIGKKIIKDKVRVRMEFNDIFNTIKERELTIEGNSRVEFYRKRSTRTFSLSCTYNFNRGKKVASKKVEQGGTEERARIGN